MFDDSVEAYSNNDRSEITYRNKDQSEYDTSNFDYEKSELIKDLNYLL